MGKENLDLSDTIEMVKQVALSIIDSEPLLTDADRNLGDGDHGLGMERGMKAVIEKIESSSFNQISDVFKSAGMAMMSSMGGASGALFGTLFRNGGKALDGEETLNSDGLKSFLNAANEGVKSRGGASPGDKTMIDALEPAAQEASKNISLPLYELISLVSQAADRGKEESKEMIATMGRAKTLGERSLGHPDAGACSVAIILKSMSEFINQ
ncbi:MAG: dihydroxyacetone kinase subunit L [Verrucomicrobiales bacterium]|nr:dihydroxyacetone kinase subunit L [Verrucomicrobiales bacterium]|tara:strand:- start:4088 stop:4723 length:636 start_codon:yes stop_codon:yes gene_type:complete